jgi:peptidoglycan hydrolase CwlO-like protein
MAKTSASPSREILEAALQGLEVQREKLDRQISEVRSLLSGRAATKSTKEPAKSQSSTSSGRSPRKKRALSQEARNRIAAAQKKRWAAFRKSQA